MDKKYFDALISEMQVLLDGQKFTLDGDVYKNEKKAVKIEYNEEIKQFLLLIADVTDGEVGEFATASSWLFDETQNEKDAAAVGVDFADTLRASLGVKKAKTVANVELPVADKSESVNIAALTQKLLAVFPQFKDAYKASVQKYNKFLYIDFFAENFVPAIKQVVDAGNKKQAKKLFDMLSEMYNTGKGETTDAVVMLLSAVQFGDAQRGEFIAEQIEENKHLKTALAQFSLILAKNKKLQSALIK